LVSVVSAQGSGAEDLVEGVDELAAAITYK